MATLPGDDVIDKSDASRQANHIKEMGSDNPAILIKIFIGNRGSGTLNGR